MLASPELNRTIRARDASLAAALSALGAGASVAAWHAAPGVCLTSGDILRVVGQVCVVAACIGAALNLAGVRPVAAALLPAGLLQASYWLPLTGKLRVHLDHTAAFVLLAAAIALGLALRGRLHRPLTFALFAVSVGLALGQHVAGFSRTKVPRANGAPIVLLTLDTLRADHLAGFGGDVETAHTPNLDAFFASARVFRHAYASIALTEPSHTTMLTGLGVEHHGVTVNGQVIPLDLPWVPEELQAAGWSTRAAVSASVLDASLGLSRGFDTFDSTFDARPSRAFAFLNWSGVRNHAGTAESRPGAATLAVYSDFPDGSFTWIHLYDAHWPYSPTPEAGTAIGLHDLTPLPETGIGREMDPSDRTWPEVEVSRGKMLYRASLQDLDALVGQLLRMLPANASIVIAGDHGESLDEHGYVFSHGRLPFAPDVHTPLAVRAPGLAPEWVDTPVPLSLIAPTLRALAGLDGAPDRGLLGKVPDQPVVTVAYAAGFLGTHQPHPLGPVAGIALRQGGRTTAWTRWSEPAGYDPIADPRELRPLPLAPPEGPALELAAGSAGHAEEPEEEMRPALEALGYLTPGE